MGTRTGYDAARHSKQIAAESIGISASKYKMLAFVVASAIAGVAGVLYAQSISDVLTFFVSMFFFAGFLRKVRSLQKN